MSGLGKVFRAAAAVSTFGTSELVGAGKTIEGLGSLGATNAATTPETPTTDTAAVARAELEERQRRAKATGRASTILTDYTADYSGTSTATGVLLGG